MEEQPFDYVLALEAADRALAVQKDLAEALFNRAEALTQLQLTRQASQAWEAYREVDRRSVWADDAAGHLEELAEPTLEDVWEQERPRLDNALARGDTKAVLEIVSLLPDRTRRYAEEELLPAWGKGTSLSPGLDPLSAARQIGTALRNQAGDAMVLDAVDAIARAQRTGDSARLAALQKGHRLFGPAMKLHNDLAIDQSRPRLVEARDALRAGGSPFARWADFYLAVYDSYVSRDRAVEPLRRLARRGLAVRYPVLVGRSEWMLGTIEANDNRAERSLGLFRSALGRLDRSMGPQEAGHLHIQIAGAYRDLGQMAKAWEERLAGLASTRLSGDWRRRHAALVDTVADLLDQEQPGAALAFADELLENARARGNPGGLAEALRQRGRVLAQLGGRDAEAIKELRAGREQAAKVADEQLRGQLLSELDVAEADLLAVQDPGQAVRLLDRALASRSKTGNLYRVPLLQASRARALRKLGDSQGAESGFRLAIEEYERIREDVTAEELRLSAFERAQELFDEMVELQIDQHGDVQEALSFAERARSRVLLDLVAGGVQNGGAPSGMPRAMPADRILEQIPKAVVLVEYLVLPDRLLAWVVRRGSVQLVTTPVTEKQLDRDVKILRSAVERGAAEDEIRKLSGDLHKVLIGPLEKELPDGSPLVIVPDRSLLQVPFAALFDPRRGRFLIEDRTVSVVPSATLYLTALERSSRQNAVPARDALVVGDPAFDQELYDRLSRLAAAKDEANEVAELYKRSGSDLLLDHEATRRAFLEQAPGHRLVHFAGHALLHPGSPRLSHLLFAPDGDDSGALYAGDLSGLRLDGTELVVLSACRTLDGVPASREGLVGLAAAFLAAGPPVVVASLWQVEDKATRELMLAFHQAFSRGADPAAALREAQRKLLSDPSGRFRSPAYWAGFEAFGGAPPREN